jgi:hypothetical protein
LGFEGVSGKIDLQEFQHQGGRIMRGMVKGVLISVLLLAMGLGLMAGTEAPAWAGEDFLFSAEANNVWVVNKATKKMVFLQFQKEETIWKSNLVTLPSDLNMDALKIQTVGSRGTSVIVSDNSSGKVTMYTVNDDRSVRKYVTVDIAAELK